MQRRGIRIDLALATFSNLSEKFLGFVVLAILARSLDKSDMGELLFATALASLFALLGELGTTRYLTHATATREETALVALSEVFSLRLFSMAAAYLGLSLFALAFMPERLEILLLAGAFVLIGDLYFAFAGLFLGLRRVGYRFVTGLIGPCLLLALMLVAVSRGWDLHAILLCHIAANVALVAITALAIRLRFGRFGLVFDAHRLRRVLREALPYFALILLALVFLKVDTLMLGFMRSVGEVADYEAGYKFFEVSRFAVRPVGMIFFAVCAQLVTQRDWPAFIDTTRKLVAAAGAGGAAMALAVIALAPSLVPAVWGAPYESSVPILRALFVGVPFLYLSFVATFLAQSLQLHRAILRVMIVCVSVNILLNVIAIPRWGALGSAWTTVISEVLLAGWLLWLVYDGTRTAMESDPVT